MRDGVILDKHKNIFSSIARIGIIVIVIAIVIGCILMIITFKNNKYKNNNLNVKNMITFTSNRIDKRDELNQLITEFEKINPDMSVKLELIGDAESVLRRKASVGELSDITMVPSSIMDTGELEKYFLDIDYLGLNDDSIYNYLGGIGNDDKLYSINSSITWVGVIYNKKIFNEAGVYEIPKNMNEFLEACRKIKEMGTTPVALNYSQTWTMATWVDIVPYLLDLTLEEDIISKKKEIISSESGIYKSLEFSRQIVKNGYCEEDLLNYGWEQFKKDMSLGKIAMTIWNSELLKQIESIGGNLSEFDIFPFPESKRIILNGDYRYAISKNTKYPEVSKAFFKFLFLEGNYYKAINVTSPLKTKNNYILNDLRRYNIPIILESELSKDDKEKGTNYHNSYYIIKKSTSLDYAKVQEYLTTSNIEGLKGLINDEWKLEIDKIMN